MSNALVAQPVIQSLNIVRNDEVICSTHKPNVGLRSGPGPFLNFHIMTSSIVLPGKTIVIIKEGDESFSVAATLYGFNLFGTFELLKKDATFHVNYNGLWVNDQQEMVYSTNPDTVYLRSTLFPYSVSTNYDYSSIFRFFLRVNSSSLVILFIFSVSCGVIYWVYGSERVMVQSIKGGLVRKEFEPYAQGVTDKNGNLTGCEVLMRWNHRGKIIRPDDFIPIAEKSELIVPMSISLIEDTFTLFTEHAGQLEDGFHIAFNISPVQLSCKYSRRLIEVISRFRQCERFSRTKIVLELTERQIVVYTPETLETIHRLHDMGVQIVIDDFGTGYSSLENLLELQIDGIKIDKRFVDKFPSDLLSMSLIDTMIHLTNKLNMPIVA
ncbi:EAL domain-containing protein [Vibrio toranzoniae]|uniref:EAL domain-containing protein n=1 Tax=Vibrio toranzoniae TaxID=1194427 RepID=UPI00137851D2|nr:EAL domain-containing protein [Vibrio toranzoniae]NAZ94377.1 EAL domain-containing protein [Vibrio toranzoniae]